MDNEFPNEGGFSEGFTNVMFAASAFCKRHWNACKYLIETILHAFFCVLRIVAVSMLVLFFVFTSAIMSADTAAGGVCAVQVAAALSGELPPRRDRDVGPQPGPLAPPQGFCALD